MKLKEFMQSHGNSVELNNPKNSEGNSFVVFDFADGVSAGFSRNLVASTEDFDLTTLDGARAFLAANRGKLNVLQGNVGADPDGKVTYSICKSQFESVDVTDLI